MVRILEKYQSKSITPVDDYECTLSDELIKAAKDLLGETSEIRDKCLTEFREWIWNNPRIEKCRMDSKFLLRFLRINRFSMQHAKECFERYLILREGIYGCDWFTNLDLNRSGLQEVLNDGLYVVLPTKAVTGETIVLVRCEASNPSHKDAGNIAFCVSTLVMETVFEEEENQIRGYRLILDMSKVKLSHYFMFSFSTWFRILKHVERTFTGRHISCSIMGLNPATRFISNLIIKNMREKMRRVVSCLSGPQELDFLDTKYLPIDLGGEYTIEQLMEPLKKTLDSWKDLFLRYSEMKINRKYYTDAVLKCDSGTLHHTLENKSAKLLTMYPDENENN
ncbi:clavesin-1-like [Chironomus tepperi]|uniref:clavesin-1-like n=1 Tax=Chironomus tepperi TaxID=113505 RepID=UPI00391F991B